VTDNGTFRRDYYRQKYTGKKIDVVLTVMAPALDFMVKHRNEIFPGVPIVSCGVEQRQLIERPSENKMTGVFVKRDFAKTAELVLRVRPQTRRMIFIAGTSDYDRGLTELARVDLRAFENRIPITYLTNLPLSELLKEVGKLPPDSVVLISSVFQDGAGIAFDPYEVVSLVSQRASVPTFGFTDQYMGRGILGGHVFSMESEGGKAAEIITRILHGKKAGDIPLVEAGPSFDTFDWKQLRRWQIDPATLPKGSLVLFHNPGFWERYKWIVLGGAIVIAGESVIIFSLLLNRRPRQRAEEEARHHRDQISRLSRVSLLGEMTASLAHELNQPLASIVTNANAGIRFLDRGKGEPKTLREILTDVMADSYRARGIINNVRNTVSKGNLVRNTIDLNELVSKVARVVRADAVAHACEVETILGADIPAIQGDPVQIQQVLVNLLSNAFDAMRETPVNQRKVEITTVAKSKGEVSVGVRDYGIGIQEENHGSLFEQFFTTKEEGLGMGLAIVRSIVEAHGGGIAVENAKGGGACFYFTLPINNEG
jgi:signal transduction histidine kinase